MHEMHKTANKDSHQLFGIRPLMEAIWAGKGIDKIFIQKGLKGDNSAELLALLREYDLPYNLVPIEKLNRLTRKNHQGVFAFLTEVEFQRIDDLLPILFEQGEEPLIVLLDKVTDVRNFGAIARSAECLGAHAIVIPTRNAAPASGDAVKTSAGALLRLPICRESNLKESIQFMRNSGLRIIGCTEKGASSLYDTDLTGPMCIILGSEEDGISPEYLKMCDEKAFIPMKGETASLNVSVASGILLSEISRQRNLSI